MSFRYSNCLNNLCTTNFSTKTSSHHLQRSAIMLFQLLHFLLNTFFKWFSFVKECSKSNVKQRLRKPAEILFCICIHFLKKHHLQWKKKEKQLCPWLNVTPSIFQFLYPINKWTNVWSWISHTIYSIALEYYSRK